VRVSNGTDGDCSCRLMELMLCAQVFDNVAT
jgi:hypothetical protein